VVIGAVRGSRRRRERARHLARVLGLQHVLGRQAHFLVVAAGVVVVPAPPSASSASCTGSS